jgi:hypothetical protein
MKSNNIGVVYIATGDSFYKEACTSAKSLKVHNDIPVCIFTEQKNVDDVFDKHILLESPQFSMLDKVINLWKSPFDKTLYIDTDTYITCNITDIFEALDYVDFMGTIGGGRGFWYSKHINFPDSLPEFNGGVLAFSNKDYVIDTLKKWESVQIETQTFLKEHLSNNWVKESGKEKWMITLDQPSLRKIIWENKKIRIAIMPDEYNALVFSGITLWGKAKIIHGHGNLIRYADQMNLHNRNRTYYQGLGTLLPLNEVSLFLNIKQISKMLLLSIYFFIRHFLNRKE